MPLYPSQVNQVPHGDSQPNPTKQAAIIITLTLVLIITWVFYSQLSHSLLAAVVSPPEFSNLLFTLIPPPLSILQLGLFILFIYSLFLAFISLSALFITNHFLRLIPIIIPPFILILFTTEINQLIITLFLVLFFHFLFLTSIAADLKLYKNFSLSRLVLPHTSYLFISLSLIMVLPTFFYLQTHPDTVPQLIQTKFIQPITSQLINTLPIDNPPSDHIKGSPDTAESATQSLIPSQFSHLITPELLNKLQPQLQPQATSPAQSSTDKAPQLPNLNQLSLPPSTSISQLTNQVQSQVVDQINQFLTPIYPFLPYVISFTLFFSIYQIATFLRPIAFIIPWIIFQFCLQLKIAKITIQNEPVQKLII